MSFGSSRFGAGGFGNGGPSFDTEPVEPGSGIKQSRFGLDLGTGGTPRNLSGAVGPIGTIKQTFLPPNQVGFPSPLLADNIDPTTKDFRDLFIGMDPVDAAVQVAVTTTRGSGSCVRDVGLRLNERKLGTTFKRITEADMRLALKPIVDRRDISIEQISFGVDAYGNPTGEVLEWDASAQINVSFINLRAFDSKTRRLKLGSGATAGLAVAVGDGGGGGGGGGEGGGEA